MSPLSSAVVARQSLIAPPAAPAFTVVVDPSGGGDVRTFMEAWALMPANGGTIRLKKGTYSITSICQVKASQTISILGDWPSTGSGSGVQINFLNGTVFDFLASDSVLVIRDVNLVRTSGNGQILFDSNVNVPFPFTPAGKVYLYNVNATVVASAIAAARIFRRIVNVVCSECTFTIAGSGDGALAEDCGTISGYRLFGSGVADIIVVNAGGGPILKLVDFSLLSVRNDVYAGFRMATNSKCVNGEFSINNAPASVFVTGDLCLFSNVRFYAPGAAVTALTVASPGRGNQFQSCDFSWQVSVTGTQNIFSGCTFEGSAPLTPRLVESGAADYNIYEGLGTLSLGAPGVPVAVTIIGAHSVYDVDNVQTVSSTPVTLDRTYRTMQVDASAGAFVVNLPTAASSKYQKFTIKKIDVTGNPVTIDGNGAETIDGNLTLQLSSQWDGVTLVSDGTKWLTVATSALPAGVLPTVDLEPMGFPTSDDTYTTFSWTNGSNTFAIAPVGVSFDVWVRGVKYTKTAAQSVVIVPAEGLWFFYFNTSGSLVGTQIPWTFSGAAPVALGYYDSTLGDMIFLADERHGLVMDWSTHQYLHLTRGFSIDPSGFPISGTIVGDGSADVHAQIGIGAGTGYDEDLQVPITDGALGVRFRQPLTLPAQVPVYYRDGAANWRKKVSNTFALLEDGVNRIKYNLNTAGVWSQPNVSANGSYMAVWICATSNYREPVVAILGQRQDTTLANAQNNNTFGALLLTGFPAAEIKVLWRVIYQTATTYANVPHARTRDFLDFRLVSSLPSGAATVTAHNALSGRDTFPAHPTTSIQSVTQTIAVTPVTLDGTYEVVLVDASGGGRIVNLPAAAASVGRQYRIKKIDLTANIVYIAPNGSELLEGSNSSLQLSVPNEVVTIVSNGTAWYVV